MFFLTFSSVKKFRIIIEESEADILQYNIILREFMQR